MLAPSVSWCWKSGWYSVRGTAGGRREYSHGSTLCAARGRMEESMRSGAALDLEMEQKLCRRVPSVLFTFCPGPQDRCLVLVRGRNGPRS